MTTTLKTLVWGAAVALVVVAGAGCGGGAELPPPVVTPPPDAGEPVKEVPVEARRLSVAGDVLLSNGTARARLVIYADGVLTDGLEVKMGEHTLEAGTLPGRYEADFAIDDDTLSLELVMRDGEHETRRTVGLPGPFALNAGNAVRTGDAIAVSWSESLAASAYQVRLTPPGGVTVDRQALPAEARSHTFGALQTEGQARVEVTAGRENEVDEHGRAVDSRRVVSRTITVTTPVIVQPAPQLEVSGRVTFADGGVVANLDVMTDGEWTREAEVYLEGHLLTFVASENGYYAEIPESELPSSGRLEVEVVLGETRITRTLIFPGAFTVQAPQQVTAGTTFALVWNQTTNATGYRLHLTAASDLRHAELGAGVRKYLLSISSPCTAVVHLSAVTQNEGENGRSRIEILRMHRFTIDVVAP